MSLKNTIRDYIIEQHYADGIKLTCTDIVNFLDTKRIDNTRRRVQQILNELVEEDDFIQSSLCSEVDDTHNGRYNESCYYCSGELNEPLEIKDPVIAFALAMVDLHLKSLLPSTFDDYFEEAHDVLKRHPDYSNWLDKIVSSPLPYDSFPVPSSQRDSVDIIYQSLLKGKQFTADYLGSAHDFTPYGKWEAKKNNSNELIAQNKIYHPLGLILRGQIIYLVAKVYGNINPDNPSPDRHFAVHQFVNVEATDNNINDSKFTFRNYILNHMIDEPISCDKNNHENINITSEVHLELYVSEAIAEYFEENSPYKLKENKSNWYEKKYPHRVNKNWKCFSADNVPCTEQLRRWIMSLQPDVEVLEPKELREKLKTITEKSSAMYEEELNWNEENN